MLTLTEWWSNVDLSEPEWLGLIVTIALAALSFIAWLARTCVRRRNAKREEATFITSRSRMLGNGMTLPFQYEIAVRNGATHPLQYAQVNYWDGTAWQLLLARPEGTTDPRILQGSEGRALVPATTTDRKEFRRRYYLQFEDPHNRLWRREIDGPKFLGPTCVWWFRRRLRKGRQAA